MGESLWFSGGPIVTCDDTTPAVEAVLVTDGRIAEVGTEHRVTRAAQRLGAKHVDLDGRTMLPGFIDAHHHFLFAALDRGTPDLEHPAGTSVEEILSLIAKFASSAPGSEWIRLQGYAPQTLRERRHPTRRELDQACPHRPLLVAARGWHDGALNTAGFAAMGWLPPQRRSNNDDIPVTRNGLPRGEIRESAVFLAEAASRHSLLDDGGHAWMIEAQAHAQDLLRAGITRVGDAAVSPEFDRLYQRVADDGLLPITVHRMPVDVTSLLVPRVTGPPTGSGPSRSPVGPAKLFLDGGELCAVCLSTADVLAALGQVVRQSRPGGLAGLRAAMSYGELPRLGRDRNWHRGALFWPQDRLESAITTAADHGLQVAAHAMGNAAINQATQALTNLRPRLEGLPGVPRVEHALICGPEEARRIADVGAYAVVSPIWLTRMGREFRDTPLPRSLRPLPLRTLAAAGVGLAGASDYPVADYRVLRAVEAAVTRRIDDGTVYNSDEALTVEEALHAFTIGAATALGVAASAGSITSGKQADLVILDKNPLSVPPDSIASLAVQATYVAGVAVYQHPSRHETSGEP